MTPASVTSAPAAHRRRSRRVRPGTRPALPKLKALARTFQNSCLALAARLHRQTSAPEAPGSPAAPGVQRIPVQDPRSLHPDLEELWGTRIVPHLDLTGVYRADPPPHAATHLQADGTGLLEVSEAGKPPQVCLIRWWLLCDKAGRPIAQEFPSSTAYAIVVEYLSRPLQGQRFDRHGIIVSKTEGHVLLQDRVKQTPAPVATSPRQASAATGRTNA